MSGVHRRARSLQEPFRITTVEQLLVADPSGKDWFRNRFRSPMVQECGLLSPVIILLPAGQFKNRIKMVMKNIMKIFMRGILMVSLKFQTCLLYTSPSPRD